MTDWTTVLVTSWIVCMRRGNEQHLTLTQRLAPFYRHQPPPNDAPVQHHSFITIITVIVIVVVVVVKVMY